MAIRRLWVFNIEHRLNLDISSSRTLSRDPDSPKFVIQELYFVFFKPMFDISSYFGDLFRLSCAFINVLGEPGCCWQQVCKGQAASCNIVVRFNSVCLYRNTLTNKSTVGSAYQTSLVFTWSKEV